MKATTQPIVTSQHLALLSREHFEDVLFVWKIRQGIENGTAPACIFSFIEWFWKNQLHDHFAREEEELTGIMLLDHPMMVKLFEVHEAIASTIKSLTEFADYRGLERLARIVECHVRFEEGYLFREIEKRLAGHPKM